MVKVVDTLGKFSVMNTQIDIEVIDNIRYVKKQIRPNLSLPCTIRQLMALMDEYIDEISSASIPMPNIKESHIENDRLKYFTLYEGGNIIQTFTIDALTHGVGLSALDEIINILIKAQKGGVFLDPHPKNFVWNGYCIHYVDFSPPYCKKFMEMRIALASEEELEIVKKNLSYFGPQYLPYHFAGDFYNIGPYISEEFFRLLFDRFVAVDVIDSNFDEFLSTAKKIRALEDLRLERGIYLL